MAVNYANALARRLDFSALAVARKEGSLRPDISERCGYCFLDKKKTLDLAAVLRLRRYCKAHSINLIHAHSTSWFLAVLVKMTMPSLKVVWHDHYGSSEFVSDRASAALKTGSYFFSGILSVNEKLSAWARRTLNCPKVIYLANFSQTVPGARAKTSLQGQSGKRVLLLANLRPQKNHSMLLEAVSRMPFCEWTFHLVGKDFEDDYSRNLHQNIRAQHLENRIFAYGSRDDVQHIISQCDIGILTSNSEGLPVALLEYGAQAKPVVVTAVGEIPSIIRRGENGLMVAPRDSRALSKALLDLTTNEELRLSLGKKLRQTIRDGYSEEAVVANYLNWLKTL